jgi:hypothetical protein
MSCSLIAILGQNSWQATSGSIAGANCRFNDHRQGSPISIRQDKQMPNTALALLDTANEPAITVEGRIRCE